MYLSKMLFESTYSHRGCQAQCTGEFLWVAGDLAVELELVAVGHRQCLLQRPQPFHTAFGLQ